MIGLDYKISELPVREKFAITKASMERVLSAYTELKEVSGCTIISTCNRTEVYVSLESDCELQIPEILCGALGLDSEKYARYFVKRNDAEAIRHLCKVSAGMDSQILGDDQIITQVRESSELSRELGSNDSYLETLFNLAIKSAKIIKTQIVLRDPSRSSAPYKAVEKIKSVHSLVDQNVVVIGNGQMGRLVSDILIAEGANVTVTIREYKKGVIQVPKGANTIKYTCRYEAIAKASIVVSATTSPHHTLHYPELSQLDSVPKIIVDLAVPRDIDPDIQNITDVTILTIDDLAEEETFVDEAKVAQAENIIEEQIEKYYRWCGFKQKIL